LALCILDVAAANSGDYLTPKGTPNGTAWSRSPNYEVLEKNLSAFLGDSRGTYFNMRNRKELSDIKKGSLFEQVNAIMMQVPNEEAYLSGGYRLLSATEAGDSDSVAMTITNGASNDIVAVAAIHRFCGRFNELKMDDKRLRTEVPCLRSRNLTIFYRKKNGKNPQLTKDIIKWSSDFINEQAVALKVTTSRAFEVQVRYLK